MPHGHEVTATRIAQPNTSAEFAGRAAPSPKTLKSEWSLPSQSIAGVRDSKGCGESWIIAHPKQRRSAAVHARQTHNDFGFPCDGHKAKRKTTACQRPDEKLAVEKIPLAGPKYGFGP